MRAYREAFVWEDGRRGLTQEELLQRMASVNSEYGERFSHATVSRWESGATRPTVSRLQAFGKALKLAPVEIDGLILLATANAGPQGSRWQAGNGQHAGYSESPSGDGDPGVTGLPTARVGQDPPTFVSGMVNFVLVKYLILGASIVGGGYGLSLLGWDRDWMPTAYVFLVTVMVFAQGFLLPTRGSGLSEFFVVSLFFLLTTPLLQFERLEMDHYGFNRIGDFAGTHMPYMLALLVNLALSSTAVVASKLLWEWHYSGDPAESSVIRRAAWATVPPVAFVYVAVVTISNTSVAIQLAVALAALAGSFTVMGALRDPFVKPSERDRQFLLSTTLAIGILSSVLGLVTILVIYVSPDLPRVLPDHNLLRSWEINFAELGFTREEALDMLNLGYMWHAVCVFTYMFFIVGGNVLLAIYRMPTGGQPEGDAAQSNGSGVSAGGQSRGGDRVRP